MFRRDGWWHDAAIGTIAIARHPTLSACLAIGLVYGSLFVALSWTLSDSFRLMGSVRAGVFHALLMASCSMALAKGGSPERVVAIALLLSVPATLAIRALRPPTFLRFDVGSFTLDLALLVILVAVALRANRYWPIAVAAFQLCIVAFHGVRSVDTGMHPVAYGLFQVFWTYAMLLLLAIGGWRHWLRKSRCGADRPWSV